MRNFSTQNLHTLFFTVLLFSLSIVLASEKNSLLQDIGNNFYLKIGGYDGESGLGIFIPDLIQSKNSLIWVDGRYGWLENVCSTLNIGYRKILNPNWFAGVYAGYSGYDPYRNIPFAFYLDEMNGGFECGWAKLGSLTINFHFQRLLSYKYHTEFGDDGSQLNALLSLNALPVSIGMLLIGESNMRPMVVINWVMFKSIEFNFGASFKPANKLEDAVNPIIEIQLKADRIDKKANVHQYRLRRPPVRYKLTYKTERIN